MARGVRRSARRPCPTRRARGSHGQHGRAMSPPRETAVADRLSERERVLGSSASARGGASRPRPDASRAVRLDRPRRPRTGERCRPADRGRRRQPLRPVRFSGSQERSCSPARAAGRSCLSGRNAPAIAFGRSPRRDRGLLMAATRDPRIVLEQMLEAIIDIEQITAAGTSTRVCGRPHVPSGRRALHRDHLRSFAPRSSEPESQPFDDPLAKGCRHRQRVAARLRCRERRNRLECRHGGLAAPQERGADPAARDRGGRAPGASKFVWRTASSHHASRRTVVSPRPAMR
jgi:hypothetical protein